MQNFSFRTAVRGANRSTERRVGPRHQLTLSVEVVELVSGTRMTGRTTDVSSGGCFMDSLIPLPVGSRIRVFLVKGGQSLHADGMVTYAQAGLGMGIFFTNLIPEHRPLLDAWLLECTSQHAPDLALFPKRATKAEQSVESGSKQLTVRRLVHLLAARGILTDADTDSLLGNSIV